MARKFLTAIDLQKNELQNAAVQNLSGAPGSPVEGQLYYDTTAHKLYWFNGTSWVDATGGAVSYATPAIALGSSAAAGSASTVIRSDSTIAAFDGTAPTTSAVGDAAAVGTANFAARRDHTHGREAFGAVTAQTTFGASSANGSATTTSHSDHTHGTPTHDDSAHSTIHLNALAAPTADVSLNSHKITNLADGTAATDAVTLGQLNSVSAGIDWKASVRVATAAALPSYTRTTNVITASANGALAAVDGVTLVASDRLLLKNGAAGADNGIYTVTTVGDGSNPFVLTRATDADASAEVTAGMATFVEEGTTNADSAWVLTTDNPITLNTTSLTFTQFSGLGQITAGAGLTKTGNTLDVGAGTGVTVNANDVAVDTSVVARKATGALTGGATSEVLTHSLGTRDVVVSVKNNASPWNEVEVEVEATSTGTVTIRAAGNLPASYTWVVVG